MAAYRWPVAQPTRCPPWFFSLENATAVGVAWAQKLSNLGGRAACSAQIKIETLR